MHMNHETVGRMATHEGITSPDDLVDFDKTTLEMVVENLRKPGDRIPNPDPNADAGSTIPRPPFVFSAKSMKRLLAACDLVRYYQTVGRSLTPAGLRYVPVIRNFEEQWKVLVQRKDDDAPEVPKVSRSLPILKWFESFLDLLSRTVGVRYIPLIYVVRDDVNVPNPPPPLETDQPHSSQHGSVEAELIARATHNHHLFAADSSAVYYLMEEGFRGTQYAAALKPFQSNKDGRGAYLAAFSQFSGKDKWEAELKRQDDLLHNRIWKGQSTFPLERFVAQHRNAYIVLTQCAQRVQFQLPNEYTRVTYLLNGIQNADAGLQAAMANIRTDEADKRQDFERAAAYLLPYDPVAKKRNKRDRDGNQIAAVDVQDDGNGGAVVSAAQSGGQGFGSKKAIGKTGVHLRWHEPEEYRNLEKAERFELYQWQQKQIAQGIDPKTGKKLKASSKASKKSDSTVTSKQLSKAVSAAVADQFAKLKGGDKDDDSIEALIADLYSKPASKTVKIADPSPDKDAQITVNASGLKSILKRVKNSKKN